MGHKIGSQREGEVWARCPFCGDSESHLDEGHLAINLSKRAYFCVRCRQGGHLTTKVALAVAEVTGESLGLGDDAWSTQLSHDAVQLPALLEGPAIWRPSRLQRWHLFGDAYSPRRPGPFVWDAFQMRDIKTGELTGIHTRFGRSRYNIGELGFGWAGTEPPLSSPDYPIVVVEGPYDVLYPNEVCTFGLMSTGLIDELSGHSIVLCPDGDVWQKEPLRVRTLELLSKLMHSRRVYLVGVEYLRDGLDPDQLTQERTFLDRFMISELLSRRRALYRRSLASYIMDDPPKEVVP